MPLSRTAAAMLSDLALMALHIRALFRMDERDRLLSTNEPDPPAAPRLYLGRTTSGNVWHFRHDLPDGIARHLDEILHAEPAATDLSRSPTCLEALPAVLSQHYPVTDLSMGPAWRFPDAFPEPIHETIPITSKNDAIVRRVKPRLAADLPWSQPCLAIVRQNCLASVCFSSRNTPDAAEAGLETMEDVRGQGYATSVTAAWARAVRAEGRLPLYSTSWDNLPSRAVARKLGLVLYGADLSLD